MKIFFVSVLSAFAGLVSLQSRAQTSASATGTTKLYIDVHELGPGKVTYEAVAQAHAKDLAVENKYGVQFLKYWVDEDRGLVYCLSSTSDSAAIRKTHAEAHGLLPDHIYLVTEGTEDALKDPQHLFLDIHHLGAGKVTAEDVAGAHKKDLAVEQKYGVHFINYWVNEKEGVVMCLSQAPDSTAVINTHRLAHGLLPDVVLPVKQGQ